VTEKFVNPRTGSPEDIEYVVNPSGAIHSVPIDHPAVRVLRGGGDIGERRTWAGFRFANNREILRVKQREGVV
jgi:hypothetical protein